MQFSSFLKLVEIQTKVASMTPFVLGTLYGIYRFQSFNLKNFVFMWVSLLAIDMATTAINNYYDYKKAIKTHGFGYESHNAIVRYKLKESTVVATIVMLLVFGVIFGLFLFFNTDIVVLLVGALSFVVGVLYSFGPIPISRLPLGELFSGVFMGFILIFLSVYIHIYDQGIITLAYGSEMLNLQINILEVIFILLISIPAINGIANIMLANNICDIEEDIENKRYTLPIFIGKEKALKVFKALYYIAYGDLILLILLGITPVFSLLALLTFIPVKKNIQSFYEKQTKEETFILAVQNFILMNIAQVIALGLTLIL